MGFRFLEGKMIQGTKDTISLIQESEVSCCDFRVAQGLTNICLSVTLVLMKWPWGTELTYRQAEETAKYLLNISQATVLGSV